MKNSQKLSFDISSIIMSSLFLGFVQIPSVAFPKPSYKVLGANNPADRNSYNNNTNHADNANHTKNSPVDIIREAPSSQKVSLPEAIQTALNKNPKTQANEMRLKSEFERLKTQKQATYLPRISVQATQGLNTVSSSSNSVSAGINWNLFNGFSDYYRLQAQECNYKRLEAQYNSTDAFIKNTSGQIAGLVSTYFINLTIYRGELITLANTLQFLDVLSGFEPTSVQQIQIENLKNSLVARKSQVESNSAIAERNYQYVVTEPAPITVENLEETIQSIIIPNSSDEAFRIGLDKSPDVLAAQLGLKCLELDHQSSSAERRGVRVDLSLNTTKAFQDRRVNTGYITISKSIGVDDFTASKSELTKIEASRLDLDGTIDDLKNNLFVNYKELEGSTNLAQSYEKSFKQVEMQIQDILNTGHPTEKQIDLLISLIGSYHGYWMNTAYTKQEIINLKFSIQRNIGTLFERTGTEKQLP